MSSKPSSPSSGAIDKQPSAAYQSTRRMSKEQLTAWQRWEMASVHKPAPESPQQPAPASEAEPVLEKLEPVLLIDEAELTRLRLEAQQTGADEGYKQGYAEGHAQGYAQGQSEGYATGLAAAQDEALRLQTLTKALPEALRSAEREVADNLLTLALDIAHQVVRQALTSDPQLIVPLVRELLRSEPTLNGTPRLLLHADDVALVRQYLNDDLQAVGWNIRVDPTITRGGCRVHAASGALDATLETRWERVAAVLGRSAVESNESNHG